MYKHDKKCTGRIYCTQKYAQTCQVVQRALWEKICRNLMCRKLQTNTQKYIEVKFTETNAE